MSVCNTTVATLFGWQRGAHQCFVSRVAQTGCLPGLAKLPALTLQAWRGGGGPPPPPPFPAGKQASLCLRESRVWDKCSCLEAGVDGKMHVSLGVSHVIGPFGGLFTIPLKTPSTSPNG